MYDHDSLGIVTTTVAGACVATTGGATVEGRYPSGRTGLAITRAQLDAWLLEAAAAAGATVEEGCRVDGPIVDDGQGAQGQGQRDAQVG